MSFDMTDEQVAMMLELGDPEVLARADKLSDYQRYDSVQFENVEWTAAQAAALAAFVKTLGPDVVIHNGAPKRVKSVDERCKIVLQNEIDKRYREGRQAAYKASLCPECGAHDVQAKTYSDKCPECEKTLPYYPYG